MVEPGRYQGKNGNLLLAKSKKMGMLDHVNVCYGISPGVDWAVLAVIICDNTIQIILIVFNYACYIPILILVAVVP